MWSRARIANRRETEPILPHQYLQCNLLHSPAQLLSNFPSSKRDQKKLDAAPRQNYFQELIFPWRINSRSCNPQSELTKWFVTLMIGIEKCGCAWKLKKRGEQSNFKLSQGTMFLSANKVQAIKTFLNNFITDDSSFLCSSHQCTKGQNM